MLARGPAPLTPKIISDPMFDANKEAPITTQD